MNFFYKGFKNLVGLKNKKVFLPRMFGNYLFAFLRISNNVPLPIEMQIEPSSVCNLRCSMCSLKNNKTPKDKYFKTEYLKKILDEIKTLKSINFTGIGESLMNSNLPDLIKIAKEKRIETMLITNGQLLSDKIIPGLIKSGLDKISISIESGVPDYYEKIRKGARFDRLKKNLKLLTKEVEEDKSGLMVIINIMLLKKTLEEIDHLKRIIDLAFENRIRLITVQMPHDPKNFGLDRYFGEKSNLEKTFNELKQYASDKNITIMFPGTKTKKDSCYYPWIYPQITADGELLPCCIVPQFGRYDEIKKKYSFGNVFRDDFKKVWNSKKSILFRKSLINNPNQYCQKCSKYLGIL